MVGIFAKAAIFSSLAMLLEPALSATIPPTDANVHEVGHKLAKRDGDIVYLVTCLEQQRTSWCGWDTCCTKRTMGAAWYADWRQSTNMQWPGDRTEFFTMGVNDGWEGKVEEFTWQGSRYEMLAKIKYGANTKPDFSSDGVGAIAQYFRGPNGPYTPWNCKKDNGRLLYAENAGSSCGGDRTCFSSYYCASDI